MYVSRRLSPDDFWDKQNKRAGEILAASKGKPIYGLKKWSGFSMLSEWSFGDSDARELLYGTVDGTPRIKVITTDRDPMDDLERLLLNRHGELPDETGTLGHEVSMLLARPAEHWTMKVDGEDTDFRVWVEANDWWGVANTQRRGISIEAREMGGFVPSLALVDDVEPYLKRRFQWIRSLRGEA